MSEAIYVCTRHRVASKNSKSRDSCTLFVDLRDAGGVV